MASLMSALGVDRMSVEDRLRLVEEIWDSLGPAAELPPLTDAQKQELDRRVAVLDANPETVSTWEEVEARILARLKQSQPSRPSA
jgi:putative addiction module component (TIGR02574 family)